MINDNPKKPNISWVITVLSTGFQCFFRSGHPAKSSHPRTVSGFAISTSLRELHWAKAYAPVLIIDFGSFTSLLYRNLVPQFQPEKRLCNLLTSWFYSFLVGKPPSQKRLRSIPHWLGKENPPFSSSGRAVFTAPKS